MFYEITEKYQWYICLFSGLSSALIVRSFMMIQNIRSGLGPILLICVDLVSNIAAAGLAGIAICLIVEPEMTKYGLKLDALRFISELLILLLPAIAIGFIGSLVGVLVWETLSARRRRQQIE